MCAAPGSKTSQLMEMMHRDCIESDVGILCANDANNSRCHMLNHQLQRDHLIHIHSPPARNIPMFDHPGICSPNLIIFNEQAQSLPNLLVENAPGQMPRMVPMKFDRVLCDVPCSVSHPACLIHFNSSVFLLWHLFWASFVGGGHVLFSYGGGSYGSVRFVSVTPTCCSPTAPYERIWRSGRNGNTQAVGVGPEPLLLFVGHSVAPE